MEYPWPKHLREWRQITRKMTNGAITKKKEAVAAYFEEFHQTKGALVGIFLHSKDLPEIGAKNTVRSSEETKWRCVKSHGEAGLRLSANQC